MGLWANVIVAAVLALMPLNSGDNDLALAGYNEDTKVDVRYVPVPLEGRYRGNKTVIVRFLDPASIDRQCGTSPGMRVIACVDEIGKPVMNLPNPCNVEFQGEDYAAVLCHEKGHTFGWQHYMPSFTRKTRET